MQIERCVIPVLTDRVKDLIPAIPERRINQTIGELSRYLQNEGVKDQDIYAYSVATLLTESGDLRSRSEIRSKFSTKWGERPYDFSRYEGRKDLGNFQQGDGVRYRGRGIIQITGRANYRSFGEAIGVNLEGNPVLANHSSISTKVAGAFIVSKISRIGEAIRNGDFPQMRRVVNGGTNGLERFRQYYLSLKEALTLC